MSIELRLRQPRIASLLSVIVCCTIQSEGTAQEAPPPTLNPKKYASPSGRYLLFVNPSDLFGRGQAAYGLTREGREVWSAEKPYTLWDACVGDDGLVTGYAYSHGWRGFSEAGIEGGMGDFRVVIIDPGGKERLEQVTKRQESNFFHTPPNPLASGLVMDAANDRLVVRVHDTDLNRGAEVWWVYQLSTGKELEKARPKELMADPRPARSLMDAKPVKGTPLTLVHWWRFDFENERKRGARFTLIGQDGKAVWSLDLPADYESGGDQNADERLMASVRRSGAILGTDHGGEFELRFVKDGQRVKFAVARAASGEWVVSEVGRRPFVETTTAAPTPEIPLVSLRATGRVVLESPASAPLPEIRDVGDFVFDPRGRIAFLRRIESKSITLLVVDQQGKVVHTVALESGRAESGWGWSELTCVGPDEFLLIRENPSDRNKTGAALVDAATGKTTPILGFTTTAGSKIAGFPDRGFVVIGGLTSFRGGATTDGRLRSFDSRGELIGALDSGDQPQNPAALFSSEGLTVTTDGMIAVVDVIRKFVQFFDRAGKHHHTVDLKKAWGREPTYPSGISADRDGGVLVRDFQGDPPIVRMNADGKVRAKVKPRMKNGAAIDLRDAQVAPDGVLWVSDGHALYRLIESGVAGSVLGEAPDAQRFDQAAAVTLDGKGNIYAVVGRTGAVHVFGADGRWLRVCLPDTGDISRELFLPDVTVSDSGDVYLGLGTFGSNRYLHFAPDGKRVGFDASKLDEISEEWCAQPGTDRRWVLGYEKIYLIGGDGAVVRTIMRRADGFWLDHPEKGSVAADGSIAVVSRSRGSRLDDGELAVSVYSPQGEPISTFTLPRAIKWSIPSIAYDGKRVAVTGEKGIVLFEASGKAIGRFTPAENEDGAWEPFLAPGGGGLVLFDGAKTLHRYELP
jgi:hypothetical protein